MTLLTALELPELDLSAPELTGDQYHRRLAALRREGWLARSPLALLVLDREAADQFLRSRATAFPGRQIAELFGITSGPLFDLIDANILNLTGEGHMRLRRVVAPAFAPAAVDRWRPTMRRILDDLWQGIGGAHAMEAVGELAKPYPARTIAAVLGAPGEDAPQLAQWSAWVQRQFDVRALATERARMEDAAAEVSAYVEGLLAARGSGRSGTRTSDAGAPGLLSLLSAAEAGGDRLSRPEVVNLAVNVLAGGIDTTASALGHALYLFATHPEQWGLVGRDPGLAGRAVGEVLRVEPVTPFTARLCTEPMEVKGVTFPAGTLVALCVERANREGGEDFDVLRPGDERTLTFGAGPHFCLGANLARAELEEALAFLAPRLAGLELDGPPARHRIDGIYGFDELRVRWSGEAAA